MIVPLKYPKITHPPFSPEIKDDDVIIIESNYKLFVEQEVVITEKSNTGNCQLFQYKDFLQLNNYIINSVIRY
jgi:hypothetical protein